MVDDEDDRHLAKKPTLDINCIYGGQRPPERIGAGKPGPKKRTLTTMRWTILKNRFTNSHLNTGTSAIYPIHFYSTYKHNRYSTWKTGSQRRNQSSIKINNAKRARLAHQTGPEKLLTMWIPAGTLRHRECSLCTPSTVAMCLTGGKKKQKRD